PARTHGGSAMKTRLASVGTAALGIAIMLALILIPVLLLQGGLWLSALLFPWLVTLNALAVFVTVVVFLANAGFSSTPKFAGSGMMIVSYVFGATLWVWSLLLTYTLWGGFWLFLGLFMAGVGVVPLAMIATFFKGMWAELGELVLLIVLTLGVRVWGFKLVERAL